MKNNEKNNNKKSTALHEQSGSLATMKASICLMKSLNTTLKTLVSIYSKKKKRKVFYLYFFLWFNLKLF